MKSIKVKESDLTDMSKKVFLREHKNNINFLPKLQDPSAFTGYSIPGYLISDLNVSEQCYRIILLIMADGSSIEGTLIGETDTGEYFSVLKFSENGWDPIQVKKYDVKKAILIALNK